MLRKLMACALLATLVSPKPAIAAEVQVFEAGAAALVFIDGEIVSGDLQSVTKALKKLRFPIVLLRSPGGDAREGMAIGRHLRSVGASTGVAPGFLCASACAMIWVSGSQRYLAPTSLVGFHGAYTVDGAGRASVSGWGNALAGAYLSELGFNEAAIIYMTAAGPSDLNWVNRSMAIALGIEVVELDVPDGYGTRNQRGPSGPVEEVQLRLPKGFRWIVLESSDAPSDIPAERWEQLLGIPIVIVKTRSGFSAAIVGPFTKEIAEELVEDMRAAGVAPDDAYLSSGNGFLMRLR